MLGTGDEEVLGAAGRRVEVPSLLFGDDDESSLVAVKGIVVDFVLEEAGPRTEENDG